MEVSSVAFCLQYYHCGGGPFPYRFPLSSLSQRFLSPNSRDICHHIAFRGVSRCTLCAETHKSFRRSHILSSRRGKSTSTSIISERSVVVWTIESDLAADQHLYITGDTAVLGCWKPKNAVLMLPTESSKLWKAEMEIACGTTLKYNYFIKGKSWSTCDIIWRPGPELTLSVPLSGQLDTEIMVRDSWIRSDSNMSSTTAWDLLVEETYLFLHPYFTDSRTDEEKLAKRTESNITKPKPNTVSEKLYANDNGRNNAVNVISNSARIFPEEYQPVEEPWLHRLPLASTSMDETKSDVPQKGEVRLEQSNKDETNQIKDSVSTVILINSSICTMQRIAVLEDGKLVELLLEPVKSEVHCDSVYIGVVTKLVPNMGSAFVNIGLGRPSLMSIDHSREPFVFPPFSQTKRQDTQNSSSRSIDGILLAANNEHPHDIEVIDETIHSRNGSIQSKNNNHDQRGGDDDFDMSHILDQDVNESTADEGDLDADFEDDLDGNEVHPTGTNGSINLKYLQDQDIKGPYRNSTCVKWNQVSRGTKIIVQVRKEGLGTKGPTLTAYPKLRSRFWILMTRCNRIGVSQKLLGAERTRLKVIANTLQPQGFGLTVRTVAAGHSLEELQRDLEGLLSTWKNIIEQAKSASLAADEGVKGAVPIILHRAMGQTLSVVQDYFNDKVQKMVVDSRRTYHEVTSYLQEMAPDLCDRVELYDKRIPLFDELKIEEEIDNMLSKKVPLVNGGSLVIEQTEALVSIDVNAGTGVFGHGTSQEKATLDVNLAAAKQIARELRLRDIGGIIVVDFIDMADESNKRLVYEEVKKAVARDRSALRISELSRNGLMEITRKRFRPSVTFMISDPCNCCHATGRVEALETSFSKIEKQICRFLSVMDQRTYPENPKSWPKFILNVDHHMCQYLTSGKNSRVAMLSSSLKVWILLKVARGFTRGTFEVKPLTDGISENNLDEVPIAKLQTTVAKSGAAIPKVNVFPVKRSKAGKRYKVK